MTYQRRPSQDDISTSPPPARAIKLRVFIIDANLDMALGVAAIIKRYYAAQLDVVGCDTNIPDKISALEAIDVVVVATEDFRDDEQTMWLLCRRFGPRVQVVAQSDRWTDSDRRMKLERAGFEHGFQRYDYTALFAILLALAPAEDALTPPP